MHVIKSLLTGHYVFVMDVGKGTEVTVSGVIINLKLSKMETKKLKFRVVSKKSKQVLISKNLNI